MLRQIILNSTLILALLLQSTGAQTPRTIISDAEIRNILAERVDKHRQAVGIVVGVIEPRGRHVIAYLSFIGYAPSVRTGIVVLSNSGLGAGIDDIGFHLLSPGSRLLQEKDLAPAKARKEVPLDGSLLERYAGRYEFPSGQLAAIRSVGGRLHLQGVGDTKIIFYPESEKSFFAKLIDAQLIFVTDAQGRVTGLNYSRSGENLIVRRLD